MKNVVVRFLSGLLFLLIFGWCVSSFFFQGVSEADKQAVRDTYSGAMLLMRDQVSRSESPVEEVDNLNDLFTYPISYEGSESVDIAALENSKLSESNLTMYLEGANLFFISKLDNDLGTLTFGPMPKFEKRSFFQKGLVCAILFSLFGWVIALMSSRFSQELTKIEETAIAHSHGNVSARTDSAELTWAANLGQAVNRMAEEFETKLLNQNEIIQSVSHELRTPLTRIHFALVLVRESKSPKDSSLHLNEIEKSVDELDGLVGEMLQHVLIQNGQVELDLGSCNLLDVVSKVFQRNSHLFPDAELEIGDALSFGEIVVHADERLLGRAVWNIVANACRYCKSKVCIDAIVEEEFVTISVCDDGNGISSDDYDKIVKPFVQLEEGTIGSGLGLAIVSKIMRNHQGELEIAKSIKLGGAKFIMRWPVPRVEHQET